MGWESCSSWKKKADVTQDLDRQIKSSGFVVLAEKSTANGKWYVLEKNEVKMIYFGLIKKSGGEFALKTMTESMGPYYKCVPVKFFDLCPTNDPNILAWRKGIIESKENAKKRKSRVLETGMKIELYGKVYKVIHHSKDRTIVGCDLGRMYKLKKSQLSQWEEVKENNLGEVANG